MQAVNKKMDPQKTLKTMQDFQKENMKMGMTEDMSKNTMHLAKQVLGRYMGIVWEVMCAAKYAAKAKYVCGMFFRRNWGLFLFCFFCIQQPSCSKVQTCDWKSIWLTFLSLSSSFLSHYLFSQRHFGWDLWRIWRWRGISGHCQPGSGWDWHWDLREGKKFKKRTRQTTSLLHTSTL